MRFRSAFSVGLLAVVTRHAHGLDISGCGNFTLLAQAFEENNHVVATIWNDLECDVWTTVEVPENKKLTVEGLNKDRRVKFFNVRFEVAERDDDGEMDLIFDTKVKFFSTIDADPFFAIQDVDGGVLNVGRGASVSFADYMTCRGIEIVSAMATDSEGDFVDYSDHFVFGGCWYNEGTIEVQGLAKFKENDNAGGGEAPPGNGGAVCNRESGNINFLGGVSFKSNTCKDDDEGRGGAIFNEGTIVIQNSAVFANNFAEGGGAIFNDGGTIEIYSEDTVSFFNNRSPSSSGFAGHINNSGSITFGCPLKVLMGNRGFQTSGHISFLEAALLKNLEGTGILAFTGSSFTGLSNVTFKSNEGSSWIPCEDIAFSDGEGGYICGP